MEKVIEVKDLTKKYNGLTAVNNISFDVNKGEIFGLLGENGAGKTTTLEIIEGLRKPTSGKISVLGHDIKDETIHIKERIGVQLQSSAYYSFLTLSEIIDLFGSFYNKSINADELLTLVDLKEKANVYINNLSGGQKQRFSIIASLVNDPEIIFLDEPTTGLDPLARRHLWQIIAKIKAQNKTIIMTTHYMEEAEILCDRIAIMDKGKLIAIDETHKLIERTKSPFKISFYIENLPQNAKSEFEKLGRLHTIAGKNNSWEMHLKSQDGLNKAIALVQKINPETLTISKASLEDLFIELTGKTIGDEESA